MKTLWRAGVMACLIIFARPALAAPTIDGSITGGEGWTIFTESGYAQPYLGGSSTTSDNTTETSQYHWWDGLTSTDKSFATGPRGGVNNLYFYWDATHLYLGVTAGTAPFNNWFESGTAGSGDQGNLYIAVDTNGGTQLNANSAHTSFLRKAVDFDGWQPDYIVGVEYFNNGGGGTGWANLEQTITHTVVAGNAQATGGSFEWTAASIGGGLAHYEFKISWSLLGFTSRPADGTALKLAMYTTQNFADFDAYDSAPGIGNRTPGGSEPFEQIGDNPRDVDTLGRLGASDDFIPSSYPGSNYVLPGFYSADINNDYNLVGHGDEIDTIEEYFVLTIPEPGTVWLTLVGVFAVGWRLRTPR
jgi:hypothetical protein